MKRLEDEAGSDPKGHLDPRLAEETPFFRTQVLHSHIRHKTTGLRFLAASYS